jgi:hypothetical protein
MKHGDVEIYCTPTVAHLPTGDFIVGVTPWVPYSPEKFEEYKNAWTNREKPVKKNSFKIVTVSSNSDPTKAYKVKLYEDGRMECECKGFMFRKSCKHVDELKNAKKN